jgi:hypothetical protein
MNRFRAELPQTRFSIEDAVALQEDYDVHEAAQRYVTALFGGEQRHGY